MTGTFTRVIGSVLVKWGDLRRQSVIYGICAFLLLHENLEGVIRLEVSRPERIIESLRGRLHRWRSIQRHAGARSKRTLCSKVHGAQSRRKTLF